MYLFFRVEDMFLLIICLDVQAITKDDKTMHTLNVESQIEVANNFYI